ncbi:MAG: 50S ribosome-binding GTPase, partial [Eggerthellaceae bacterium]|nr:50S ribosome-binding GTPase [Eggerthellaceae bacterium]
MKTYALIGNPNCGKTTLFNELTGTSQHVGNWPGVTVEKKVGHLVSKYGEAQIVDLPGIYSLSPHSIEEIVSRDFIINEKPDVVIDIVEATNIERNLFLTTQIAELGVPLVVAVNMMDEANRAGDIIDIEKLSDEWGLPVVPITAVMGVGVIELMNVAGASSLIEAVMDEASHPFHDGEDEHGHGFHDTEDPEEHRRDHHTDEKGR